MYPVHTVLSSTEPAPMDGKSVQDSPYLVHTEVVQTVFHEYNPEYAGHLVPEYSYGPLCKCGHQYTRHFDSHARNHPVGCKYCDCDFFEPAETK